MKDHHHNILWASLIIISVVGTFFLIKVAYANPTNLPNYAFLKADIKEAYTYAQFNPEKLNGLPCNCGCMTDAKNHGGRLHSRGLIDCFMKGDINKGGEWDSHASECGLCYQDALDAKRLYGEGKSKDEIKVYLMDKYSRQTFGKETVY